MMKRALHRGLAPPGGPLPARRPGALVERVLADLHAVRDADAAGIVTARLPNGVRVGIGEQVERQFLMQTASVTLTTTACGPSAHGRARVRQTGWLRRTGIAAEPRPGSDRAFVRTVAALVAEPPFADALRPLHLTDCTIDASDGRWTLAVVPFGGSEVVNRLPSFRRYVRVTDEQAAMLSAAFHRFETVLRGILRE
ncbi:hypothetical protein BDAG_03597 [Burkholderia dolosa AU0158]|nr:hypothetical protein BDAG_03597 [Burkholderia dolosa AU0158]VWB86523.1 hypothetical protein BDO18943_04108 [Burkholderia dolosa]